MGLFVFIPIHAVNRRPNFDGGPVGQSLASVLLEFYCGLLKLCAEGLVLLAQLLELLLEDA